MALMGKKRPKIKEQTQFQVWLAAGAGAGAGSGAAERKNLPGKFRFVRPFDVNLSESIYC